MEHIPFNKPCLTGKEAHYMYKAVYTGKLSGNGYFTKNVSSSLRINMVSRNVCSQLREQMPWRCVQCYAN